MAFITELFGFYDRHRRVSPTDVLTRLSYFNAKKVGKPAAEERKLATKGAETWGMNLFCNDLLGSPGRRHLVQGGNLLVAAGLKLEEFVRQLQAWPMNLSAEQRALSMLAWQRVVALARDIPGVLIPKLHSIYHMILSMDVHGEPAILRVLGRRGVVQSLEAILPGDQPEDV